jgi:thioesterase domain-containing protein
MKRGRDGHVLVLPGLGGSVLRLVWLARAYPGPETVSGLELATAAGPESITALAAGHLAATGPSRAGGGAWHLVGHCLGATVAMEMAHRLAAAGEPLGAVVLLEPFLRLGGELEAEERRCAAVRRAAAARVRALLERTPEAERGAHVGDPAAGADLAELDLDPALLRFGVEFARHALTYVEAALPAYVAHEQRPVPAPVHLLLAEGSCGDAAALTRRLRELTAGVTVHRFACSPAEVLHRPHAAVVAARVAALTAG